MTRGEQCLREAALMQSGVQLRLLFVTILTYGSPANPRQLWTHFEAELSDDCSHRLCQSGIDKPTEEQARSLALSHIAQMLATSDKTLDNFDLPNPTIPTVELEGNKYIIEQLDNNKSVLREEVAREIATLNVEQHEIYDKIMC